MLTDSVAPLPDGMSTETQLALIKDRLGNLSTQVGEQTRAVRELIKTSQDQALERARVDAISEVRLTDAHKRLDTQGSAIEAIVKQLPNFVTQSQHTELLTVMQAKSDKEAEAQKQVLETINGQAEKNRQNEQDLSVMRRIFAWGAVVLGIVAASLTTGLLTGHFSLVIH